MFEGREKREEESGCRGVSGVGFGEKKKCFRVVWFSW